MLPPVRVPWSRTLPWRPALVRNLATRGPPIPKFRDRAAKLLPTPFIRPERPPRPPRPTRAKPTARAPEPEVNTFASLHIHPVLVRAVAETFAVRELTELQGHLLRKLFDQSEDLVLRAHTGTGKSFAILLYLIHMLLTQGHLQRHLKSLRATEDEPEILPTVPSQPAESRALGDAFVDALNLYQEAQAKDTHKSSAANGLGNLPHPSALILAPNTELALQFAAWADRLLEACQRHLLAERVDADRLELPAPGRIVTNATLCQVLYRGGADPEAQARVLATTTPWLLIATPQRLQEIPATARPRLDRLRWLVLDEVDHLLSLPRRFAPVRQRNIRRKHPKGAELLTDLIMGRTAPSSRVAPNAPALPAPVQRPRLLVNSATINRDLRYFITHAKGWTNGAAIFLDGQASGFSPATLRHHCLLLNHESIRNLKPKASDPNPEVMSDLPTPDDSAPLNADETLPSVDGSEDGPPVTPRVRGRRVIEYGEGVYEAVAEVCRHETYDTLLVFIHNDFSTQAFIDRLAIEEGVRAQAFTPDAAPAGPEGRILVLGERTARGLDIPGVTHVLIVDIPSSVQSFIHMAGRTGRMGRSGKVFALLQDRGSTENRAQTMYAQLGITPQPYELVE
ncbi:hypothetical protein IWQ60_003584 [Tieghemiomyces parasiticus]|uniref:ATP-dependent RNA helicase n=1 Tax=Tieghemiomyces parasiticus TaxID=78921 RepID=A0A9W8ACM3_9FUNG|nr:hypothetical protein IWQ60_003584 [Tieghemiomyces parasiticus]